MRIELKHLELALRLGLGGILAYAAVHKLVAPEVFVEQVANYQWYPETSLLIGVLLPPIELVAAIGLWLLGPHWRQAAALLTAGMFALFTLAVTRVVWLDINVDCGCFGAGSGDIGPLTVLRNVALTGAAAWLVALTGRRVAQTSRAPQAR